MIDRDSRLEAALRTARQTVGRHLPPKRFQPPDGWDTIEAFEPWMLLEDLERALAEGWAEREPVLGVAVLTPAGEAWLAARERSQPAA